MTTPQGSPETPSAFNARSDSAAQSLRASLVADGAQMPASAPVEVGPDGKPPAPPPPAGSYAAMALEQQQAQAAHAQQIGDQPPAGTPAQAIDGSQAPPLTPPGPAPQSPPEAPSPRAEQRIQELIAKLKTRDAEVEQLRATGQQAGASLEELQGQLAALQQQHQQMLQANLDHLDPETRMQVLSDARMQQMFDQFEQRMLGRIQPQLQQIETRDQRREMQDLSNVYPKFDLEIHGPLIDMFRGKNPACTIEQAFRAIAEPEELVTRDQARVTAIPPVVAPSPSAHGTRFAPAPEPPPSDPQAELVDEARRIKEMRMSDDPNIRKQGLDLMTAHLGKRLG